MKVFIFLFFCLFIQNLLSAYSNNTEGVKLISYYEESLRDYKFYYTLHQGRTLKVVIKRIEQNDYVYEVKLSNEETKKIFKLVEKINFNDIVYLEPISRGSNSFRLEVLYDNHLRIIHSDLKNINQSDGVFLLHQRIKKYFKYNMHKDEMLK